MSNFNEARYRKKIRERIEKSVMSENLSRRVDELAEWANNLIDANDLDDVFFYSDVGELYLNYGSGPYSTFRLHDARWAEDESLKRYIWKLNNASDDDPVAMGDTPEEAIKEIIKNKIR